MTVPRAIMLAAGVGRRIAPAHRETPKCLLEVGGKTLLARHLEALAGAGVAELHLCVGFEHKQIEAALAAIDTPLSVATVYNPDYRSGSVVSLWCMREILAGGQPALLMDADVLYPAGMLARLANTAHANAFLLDREFEAGEEPVKLCLRSGRVVEFRKQLPRELEYDVIGESVGFFRFSADVCAELGARCDAYVAAGRRDEPYEEVLRDCVLAAPESFGYEDVTGVPWIEIDFPEDIEHARERIFPSIRRHAA